MAVSAIVPSVLYSPAPHNKRDGTISAASRVSLDGFLKKRPPVIIKVHFGVKVGNQSF